MKKKPALAPTPPLFRKSGRDRLLEVAKTKFYLVGTGDLNAPYAERYRRVSEGGKVGWDLHEPSETELVELLVDIRKQREFLVKELTELAVVERILRDLV